MYNKIFDDFLYILCIKVIKNIFNNLNQYFIVCKILYPCTGEKLEQRNLQHKFSLTIKLVYYKKVVKNFIFCYTHSEKILYKTYGCTIKFLMTFYRF